jgi:hypothetical protein
MPRSLLRLSAVVILAAAVLTIAGRAPAADAPLAGNWTFKDVTNGNDVTLAILQIEEKDGKTEVKSLSAPLLGDKMVLKNVRVDGRSLHFDFEAGPGLITVSAAAAKGDEKPKVLRGTIKFRTVTLVSVLERTEAKEISAEDAQKKGPAALALEKAREADPKDRPAALKEVIEKFPGSGADYSAAESLFQHDVKEGAKDDDLRADAERVFKAAAPFGPDLVRAARLNVPATLARAEKVSPLAVEYASAAEKALANDSPTYTASVLKTLELALRKTGKADDAKAVSARVAEIEKVLDVEFEKTAIPFKPEEFKGRKGKSNRVAVVELFTGAQCPPCVSADIAFDAAAKTYKPSDVVLLQYHLHIPGPDPLTNADSEKRQKYYGDDIRGTPTMFVNGTTTPPLGGLKQHGEDRYGTLRKLIDGALETDATADLKLSVDRKGDALDIKATVADLKKPGEKVHLRFVLIEDVARYAGSNGQRLHHHVVRAFPGGTEGFPLKEAKGEQTVKVVIKDLRDTLNAYLDEAGKRRPFRDDERPLDLKHLKVVALIQDDDSKEILQAAQVEVPAAQ